MQPRKVPTKGALAAKPDQTSPEIESDTPWMDAVRPIVAKFETSYVSGGIASFNAEGSKNMAHLLTSMAEKLDYAMKREFREEEPAQMNPDMRSTAAVEEQTYLSLPVPTEATTPDMVKALLRLEGAICVSRAAEEVKLSLPLDKETSAKDALKMGMGVVQKAVRLEVAEFRRKYDTVKTRNKPTQKLNPIRLGLIVWAIGLLIAATVDGRLEFVTIAALITGALVGRELGIRHWF